MAIGPGAYDAECTAVRESTRADLVALIVKNGTRGDGFSVQMTTPELHRLLPSILRYMADQIESDFPPT